MKPLLRAARCPVLYPRPSMSIAPRPAKWNSHSTDWSGQPALFGQRQSASPSRPHERGPARGAGLRHLPLARVLRPFREDRPDDLRDHVAGAANDHRVALADVLPPDLVLVVQRRVRDRDAAHEHGLEDGERRDLPGAAGVDLDRLQQRGPLLRRELVGDRPPGSVARRAEPSLELRVVDLDHGAVDLPVEGVPLLLPSPEEGDDLLQVLQVRFGRRRHRQPHRSRTTRGTPSAKRTRCPPPRRTSAPTSGAAATR